MIRIFLAAAALLFASPALADKLADAQWVCSHLDNPNYTPSDIAWAKTLVPDCGSPAPAPTPAPSATKSTNAAGFLKAVANAGGGDVITLAPGTYSSNLTGYKFAKPVILQGQPGVKFKPGVIKNIANLTFRGVTFQGTAKMGSGAAIVRLETSEGISFEGSAFVNSDHTGWGVYARSAGNSNIRIVGNRFTDLSRGVVFYGGAGIQTEGNSFSGIGDDCVNYSNLVPFGPVRNTISRNTARNSFYNPGSHRDFAQLMANRSVDVIANDLWFDSQAINDFGSPKPNTDLIVRSNIIRLINYPNSIRFDVPGTTGAANDNQVFSGKAKAIFRLGGLKSDKSNRVDGKVF